MLVVLAVAALVGCGSSTQTSLTFGPGLDAGAATNRIVFRGGTWGGNGDIYVMNADGSHAVRLTNTPAIDDDYPAWSRDRKKIAFVSNPDGTPYQLYTMDADGTGVQRLTHSTTEKRWWAPAWAPNGKRIAFAAAGPSSQDIYTVRVDGGGLKRLTPGSGSSREPSWSPDGTKIAYSSNSGSFDMQIWVMNADGSAPQKLTTFTGDGSGDKQPDWSPDGTRILFTRWVGTSNAPDICRIKADGSGFRRLTRTTNGELAPRWSPDGTRIAFWYTIGPYEYRIHTIKADGSNVQVLAGSGNPDDRNEDW
jgi:TolB protein